MRALEENVGAIIKIIWTERSQATWSSVYVLNNNSKLLFFIIWINPTGKSPKVMIWSLSCCQQARFTCHQRSHKEQRHSNDIYSSFSPDQTWWKSLLWYFFVGFISFIRGKRFWVVEDVKSTGVHSLQLKWCMLEISAQACLKYIVSDVHVR